MAEPLQPGYENQPPAAGTVVCAQPIASRAIEYTDYPAPALCNRCHREGITEIQFKDGTCTYVTTCITCCILPMGCAIIPFMMDSLKDVVHTCPHCANLIAIYRR